MNKRTFMRLKSLTFAVVIFAMNGGSAQNKPSIEEGFTTLFNGENWDGWYLQLRNGDDKMAKKVFAIEDGMVHVFNDTPDSLDLNTGENSTHGMFYIMKKYSKYILRFEYKWGKKIANNFEQFQYDAGMFYHVYDDKIWPKGIEYQIRYDHTKNQNHTGDFWAKFVTIKWYGAKNGSFLMPKNGGLPSVPKTPEHRALADAPFDGLNDQWNQCEVIVMGDAYTIHKLNDEIVNIATDLSQNEGNFGFQSETAEIYYRNIRIKEFESVVPMKEFID
ncbi:DUF1080 domain-containing protein [Pricia sp.]|uniref:3-keto-disaccharide hydrolase n=1 Tax=Pricia sp. TaxID=2268138 RepID=UPI0035940A47